ncbi:TELO2-interacting protein 1 homolog [Parasteatoda tepidariorum]|uniref:TELO2-interacting protein 1 homolog n=1 Tax=Parasteatoda tepidariorum TaxID=114398 RepID=UPI001C71D136|nr:TELO2-interacting protein 1 homolog [Parasteatoda tepidariorum]
MESPSKLIFKRLQPVCVKIARDCSIEDLDKLLEILKDIDADTLKLYHEYIIFPLRLILLKKPGEKVLIKAVDCLTYLYNNFQLRNSDTFTTNFQQLTNLLTNIEKPEEVSDASEELKLSVCNCITSLVKSLDDELLYIMYDQTFRLTLAQAFFVFVQLLKHEKSKSLRQNILQTIGVLAYNPAYQTSRSLRIEEVASKSLTHYFPGLASALIGVICGDVKQGQNVIRTALNIFSELIALVLGDHFFENSDEAKTVISTKKVSKQSKLENIVKDDEWLKDTSFALKGMIVNMKVLITHDHWKVRYDLLKFVDCVFSNCLKTLENSISTLLSIVFALSADTHKEISNYSSELIVKFSRRLQTYHSMSLFSFIEEDIHSSSSKLIKCKFSSNDSDKLAILRTIQGYIHILGKSVDNLLGNYSNLERIFLSLMNILEFDLRTTNVVEDLSVLEDQNVSSPISDLWPKKKFIYFQSEDIVNTVLNICYYFGLYGNVRLITDYVLDKQQNSELYDLQCIFLISRIFEGVSHREKAKDYYEFIEDILVELLSSSEWIATPENIISPVNKVNMLSNEMHCNHKIQKKCLVLETIGKSAKVLKVNFRQLLMKVLFPVLEQVGSVNSVLSNYGRICLHTISNYCEYSSVRELIHDNVDYIMNSITVNFHHFVSRPEMAIVLSVSMKESDSHILPLVKDNIHHILNLLDCNQDKACILLEVIKSIVHSIKLWFSVKEVSSSNVMPSKCELKCLKTAVLEYKSAKKQQLDEENVDVGLESKDDSIPEDSSIAETDFKAPPPLHVSLVTDILKRCCHHQSSNDLYVKISSLEVIEDCIVILGAYEVQLHPVIHELWPRFVWRFREEPAVALIAFKVLLVMADKCRDFVRARVLKDVAIKLISLLKNSYSSSVKKNYRNYQWQNACKLHLYVLSEIGVLYTKIDVSERDIAELAEVCLPYLNKSQSKAFQEAAYRTIKALYTLDPDAMWLYYNILYCDSEILNPLYSNLQILNFPISCSDLNEYKI